MLNSHATDNFLLPTCNFKRLQHVKLPYKLLKTTWAMGNNVEFSAGPHLLLPPGSRAKNRKREFKKKLHSSKNCFCCSHHTGSFKTTVRANTLKIWKEKTGLRYNPGLDAQCVRVCECVRAGQLRTAQAKFFVFSATHESPPTAIKRESFSCSFPQPFAKSTVYLQD